MKRFLRWGLNPFTAVSPHANNPGPKPAVVWRPIAGDIEFPPPVVRINDAAAVEGNPVAFTISLNRASDEDIVLDLGTTNGTAVGGVNYEVDTFEVSIDGGSIWNPAGGVSGTEVTFDAGRTSLLVRVDTVAFPSYSGNLTFILRVDSVISGDVSSSSDTGVGTIQDAQSAPDITIGDAAATEGAALDFALTASVASTDDLVLDMATADGTAVGGVNYETSGFEVSTDGGSIWNPAGGASQTEVSLAAGETTLLVRVDSIAVPTYTGDLTFTLGVGSVVSGSAGDTSDIGTGTVQDAQSPPNVAIADSSATEGSPIDFIVTLSLASSEAIILDMEATDGTAIAGVDYQATGFQVSTDGGSVWNPAGGASETQATFGVGAVQLLVRVQTIGNDIVDGDRAFTLGVGSVVSGTVGATTDTGTGTVEDDDTAGEVEQLFQGSVPNSAMISVSSIYAAGYEGANAFDGYYVGSDNVNRWLSSNSTSEQVNPNGQCWAQWDFGAPKKISQVRFGPRGATGNVNNFPFTIRALVGGDPTFATYDEENTITNIVYNEGAWGDWLALVNKAGAQYLRVEFHVVSYQGSLGSDYEIVAIQEVEFYELVPS